MIETQEIPSHDHFPGRHDGNSAAGSYDWTILADQTTANVNNLSSY